MLTPKLAHSSPFHHLRARTPFVMDVENKAASGAEKDSRSTTTVESYLDTGDRAKFENGGGPIALHPRFTSRLWEAMGCAPLVVVGREINAVREKIAERARHAGSVASTRAKSF